MQHSLTMSVFSHSTKILIFYVPEINRRLESSLLHVLFWGFKGTEKWWFSVKARSLRVLISGYLGFTLLLDQQRGVNLYPLEQNCNKSINCDITINIIENNVFLDHMELSIRCLTYSLEKYNNENIKSASLNAGIVLRALQYSSATQW